MVFVRASWLVYRIEKTDICLFWLHLIVWTSQRQEECQVIDINFVRPTVHLLFGQLREIRFNQAF